MDIRWIVIIVLALVLCLDLLDLLFDIVLKTVTWVRKIGGIDKDE